MYNDSPKSLKTVNALQKILGALAPSAPHHQKLVIHTENPSYMGGSGWRMYFLMISEATLYITGDGGRS